MRSLLLAPFAVGLVFVAQESAPKRSVTFGKNTLEARGACSVSPESISCWDMDGAKSPELEDGVRSALANGNEVQFRFGKKNRYLAIRRPQSLGLSYRAGSNNSIYSNWSISGDPMTEFVRIPAAPSDKEITLTVQTNIQAEKEESILLKEGSKGQIDGRTVEIGAIQKVDPSKAPANNRIYFGNGGQPRQTEGWSVVIGVNGKEGEYVAWAYTPLDEAGQTIRYVDTQGKPLTAMKALALEPGLQNGGYNGYSNPDPSLPKPKAAVAYFMGAGQGPAFRAVTNIDPKYLASLRIRASHQETADLGPFPLDPK